MYRNGAYSALPLPMRVLHGVCYSYTSGGDDQSPNVVNTLIIRWFAIHPFLSLSLVVPTTVLLILITLTTTFVVFFTVC